MRYLVGVELKGTLSVMLVNKQLAFGCAMPWYAAIRGGMPYQSLIFGEKHRNACIDLADGQGDEHFERPLLIDD